jgi:hypothetical protein
MLCSPLVFFLLLFLFDLRERFKVIGCIRWYDVQIQSYTYTLKGIAMWYDRVRNIYTIVMLPFNYYSTVVPIRDGEGYQMGVKPALSIIEVRLGVLLKINRIAVIFTADTTAVAAV